MSDAASAARRPSWPTFAILALAVAGFALTVRVFYPGVMTWDAWYVHSYIAAGRAGDWQSPLMTALWALIDPIAPGAGSMFLLIAALYWLSFAALAVTVARHSTWLGLLTPLLALTPSAFVFAGIIWRDVMLASLWLTAAALAFAVAERRGVWRLAAQALALVLLIFGFLLRPNALFAGPILAAYIIWPDRFAFKRAALFYVPAAIALYATMPLVYYGLLDAKRENALHAIFVFDLAGITHFTKTNQFPVTWSAAENKMLTESCYQPTDWDIYWTRDCKFVMGRLEREKLFGSSALTEAWLRAIAANPLAYLEHRFAVTGNFLANRNLTMWTVDIARPGQTVFAGNPWFMAVKAMHDRVAATPLFRAGAWLLLCVLWCALAWRRRASSPGAFVLGVCGAAVVYMVTFLPVGVAADFRYALPAVFAGLAGAVVLALRTPAAGAPKSRNSFTAADCRRAATALLMHVATLDGGLDEAGQRALRDILERHLSLDPGATEDLIAAAQEDNRKAVDLYRFTNPLMSTLDEAGRQRVVEMLWEMAYADGVVSKLEANAMWRIADLLGVSSRDRIALRDRVANARAPVAMHPEI